MKAFYATFSINNMAWVACGMADGNTGAAVAFCAIGCVACVCACYLYNHKED